MMNLMEVLKFLFQINKGAMAKKDLFDLGNNDILSLHQHIGINKIIGLN